MAVHKEIQVANNLKNDATSSVIRKHSKENNVSHFMFQTYKRICLMIIINSGKNTAKQIFSHTTSDKGNLYF